MELFYCHPEDISREIIKLDDFETKHVIKTLRKKVNDKVEATDGLGKHFSGRIISLKPQVKIQIESINTIEKAEHEISLGIGFIRPNRLEMVLEKSTEIGVNCFYLFRSEHSNYFSDNKNRFKKILRQAIKQSNRFYLPDIHLCPSFKDFLKITKPIEFKIAAISAESQPLKNIIKSEHFKNSLIAIGPEGGFSENEIILLKENKFQDVSLGNNRLRAETAALAAISYLTLND